MATPSSSTALPGATDELVSHRGATRAQVRHMHLVAVPTGTEPSPDTSAALVALPDSVRRRFEVIVMGHPADDDLPDVLDRLWRRRGVAPGEVLVVGPPELAERFGVTVVDPGLLDAVFVDQGRRLREPHPPVEVAGWSVRVVGMDPGTEAHTESVLTIGDGRFGVSGTPSARDLDTNPWVLAAGCYDKPGSAARLLVAPAWQQVSTTEPPSSELVRILDLHGGVLHETDPRTGYRATRFTSLARPGVGGLRAAGGVRPSRRPARMPAGADPRDTAFDGTRQWVRALGLSGGVAGALRDHVEDGVLERLVAYVSDPQQAPTPPQALAALDSAEQIGFDALLAEHRAAWAARWEACDVEIDGDPELQEAARFALFHLIGATASGGEAAVGARGLTGQAYSGHVFWDSDTFVLPFFAATHPAAARAMLEYRLRRLAAAQETATREGRRGARFPWESAGDGTEAAPTRTFDPFGNESCVLTGDREIHIVAQVALAADTYHAWTGDDDFAAGEGRHLIVECARYWADRVEVDGDGTGHLRGVIGPDEYHEHVDDSAATNALARWNLRRAAQLAGVGDREAALWRRLADALVDGFDPERGLHEQHEGYFDLDDVRIAELAARPADGPKLLGGLEAVARTQVLKQADVIIAHQLVPGELQPGTLSGDLDYYEPRTAHGSSLSPGIYASQLARAGRADDALAALGMTARLDLDDLAGNSSGGMHLACMGSVWLALTSGFAGIRPSGDVLDIDPHLPSSWNGLRVRVTFRGTPVVVSVRRHEIEVSADAPVRVRIGGAEHRVGDEPVVVAHRCGADPAAGAESAPAEHPAA